MSKGIPHSFNAHVCIALDHINNFYWNLMAACLMLARTPLSRWQASHKTCTHTCMRLCLYKMLSHATVS